MKKNTYGSPVTKDEDPKKVLISDKNIKEKRKVIRGTSNDSMKDSKVAEITLSSLDGDKEPKSVIDGENPDN